MENVPVEERLKESKGIKGFVMNVLGKKDTQVFTKKDSSLGILSLKIERTIKLNPGMFPEGASTRDMFFCLQKAYENGDITLEEILLLGNDTPITLKAEVVE